MSQHHLDSFMESMCNCVVGMAVAMPSNAIFIPMITGHPVTVSENTGLAAAYTVISIVRSYTIRRIFNGRTIWSAIREKFA